VTDADTRVVARRTIARGFGGALGIGFRVGAAARSSPRRAARRRARTPGSSFSQAASPATVIDGWTARNGIGVAIEGQRGGRDRAPAIAR